MSIRLPSLPALRVFEAAGRHLSFTTAGQELNVTQAAVSHQIRVLEEQLGCPLFYRSTRRLTLTAAGRRLLPAVTAAFDGLGRALSEIRRDEGVLAITTTRSFGARWLAPRLGRFAERYPDIDVTIRHTNASLDLAEGGLDLGIRWGRGRWPGLEAELIGATAVVPVAAPDYIERLDLRQRADVAKATLLHDETREDWTEWLLTADLDPSLAQRGLVFDDGNAVIQAALAGQGLALMPRSLVAGDIEARRLVALWDLSLDEGYGYYLVYLPGALRLPKVAAFRAFMREEMARAGEAVAVTPPRAPRPRPVPRSRAPG
jgi:LysR family glycine cleavage system transcriptional activator